MKTPMKLWSGLVGLAMLACIGGESDAPSDSPTAPSISIVRLKNNSLTVDVAGQITGSVDFLDSDGDVEKFVLSVEQPDGGYFGETEVDASSVSGQTSGTFEFPEFTYTAPSKGDYKFVVQAIDARGQRSEKMTAKLFVNDLSGVRDVCSKTNTDCGDKAHCFNLDQDTCTYLEFMDLELPECAKVSESSQPVCVTSLKDEDAIGAVDPCPYAPQWHNPTSLQVDCRCPSNALNYAECRRPYNLSGAVELGSGPKMYGISGYEDSLQGALIGRTWYVPLNWNTGRYRDQALIFGINIDTGDRRIVSGAYNDDREGYKEVGEGDSFLEINHVVAGPDGKLYATGGVEQASEPKIWMVDPDTGDRELIFDPEDTENYTLCDNGNIGPAGRRTVQLTSRSMAIDDDGNFYFASISYGLPGAAIAKIDRQTKACSYVSVVVNPNTPDNTFKENVGGGYDDIIVAYRGLLYKDGKIYAMAQTKMLEIDVETGDRKLLSYATPAGPGAGPTGDEGIGDNWIVWDEGHQLFWTVGAVSGLTVIAIDPVSGDRYALPCWHPTKGLTPLCDGGLFINPGYHNNSGFVVDPEPPHDLLFIYDDIAMLRYDVIAGQSNIVSM